MSVRILTLVLAMTVASTEVSTQIAKPGQTDTTFSSIC